MPKRSYSRQSCHFTKLLQAISPDGVNLITAGTTGIIVIWDLTTGKTIREFGDSFKPCVYTLKLYVYPIVSQDWQTIWRVDYQAKIVDRWNLKTGELIKKYRLDLEKCSAATIIDDSTLIVAGGFVYLQKIQFSFLKALVKLLKVLLIKALGWIWGKIHESLPFPKLNHSDRRWVR